MENPIKIDDLGVFPLFLETPNLSFCSAFLSVPSNPEDVQVSQLHYNESQATSPTNLHHPLKSSLFPAGDFFSHHGKRRYFL